jgi:phosphate transport system permease protein
VSSSSPTPRGGAGRVAAAAGATTAQVVIGEQSGKEVFKGRAFFLFVLFCALVGVVGLVTLIVQAFVEGLPRLNLDLITNFPSSIPGNAGYQSAIVGTLILMAGVLITVVPLGVGAALYLEEYADNDKWWNRLIEINIANLAAVPSIVFGILGIAFIVRGPLSLGPVAYAGSLTLSLMVLPTVILASREAIKAVPDSIRQGSLALGATKMHTIRRQVLPAAIPGIATGVILAMARAIGETAPLLLVGATVFVTFNPSGPFEGSFTALPVQIFNYVTRPQDEFRVLAAAGIILLLVVLMIVNSFAIWLRNRYQRKW